MPIYIYISISLSLSSPCSYFLWFLIVPVSKQPPFGASLSAIETEIMERDRVRIPPQRGAIKGVIMKEVVKKVKEGASMASRAIEKASTTIKVAPLPPPPPDS